MVLEDFKVRKLQETSPRRFKLALGAYEFRFNYNDQVYTISILSIPVLHMVDRETHFQAAALLRSKSTK